MRKSIKVCKKCSNVNVAHLKAIGKARGVKVKTGCIRQCQPHEDLAGQSIGVVAGTLVTCPDEESLVALASQPDNT